MTAEIPKQVSERGTLLPRTREELWPFNVQLSDEASAAVKQAEEQGGRNGMIAEQQNQLMNTYRRINRRLDLKHAGTKEERQLINFAHKVQTDIRHRLGH